VIVDGEKGGEGEKLAPGGRDRKGKEERGDKSSFLRHPSTRAKVSCKEKKIKRREEKKKGRAGEKDRYY